MVELLAWGTFRAFAQDPIVLGPQNSFERWWIDISENICFRIAEDLESNGAMMILQRRYVVVTNGKFRSGIDLITVNQIELIPVNHIDFVDQIDLKGNLQYTHWRSKLNFLSKTISQPEQM